MKTQILAATNTNTINLEIGNVAKEQGVIGTKNYNPTNSQAGFGVFISDVLNIIVVISAILLFFYLIWGGVEWITAGGESGKIEKARNKISQSIVGMIVLASSLAIFIMLQKLLGFEVITLN